MKKSLPSWLVFIAIFQIIPVLIFPLDVLKGLGPLAWAIPVALFALIGWGLLRGRVWAHTSAIFIQGFSVIVRLLSLLPGAVTVVNKSEGITTTHTPMIIAALLSIALSTIILFAVEHPEITAIME